MDNVCEVLAALHAERHETARRVDEFDSVAKQLANTRGDSDMDDEHDPEGSTIAWERAAQEAIADAARHHLAEIDAALDRVRGGWAGTCIECGTQIPPERLAARPSADRCVACASARRR